MHRIGILLLAWLWWGGAHGIGAETASHGRIIKVLPQFIDKKGKHSPAPSLFDRDAYQLQLQEHPDRRGGLRFQVQWKLHSRGPCQLRVELRGARDKVATTAKLEANVQRHGWFSRWTQVTLTGDAYRNFGDLVAWRATIWDGDRPLAESKSFLW